MYAEGISTPKVWSKVGEETVAWYAMQDVKRPNAIDPAYKMLERMGYEVFTPMKQRVVVRPKIKFVEDVPVIHDLLFVHSTIKEISLIVSKTPTLRYRFVRGGGYKEATIIGDRDMLYFINAVKNAPFPKYYVIDEITPDMIGRKVHIHGGSLDGFEVYLRKMRGSHKKRIIVKIPQFVAAEIELTDFDFLEDIN